MRTASKIFLRRVNASIARGGVARVDRQEVPHIWNVAVELTHPSHPVLDLGDDLGLAVELLDAEVLAELVDQRQERNRLAERDAAAPPAR